MALGSATVDNDFSEALVTHIEGLDGVLGVRKYFGEAALLEDVVYYSTRVSKPSSGYVPNYFVIDCDFRIVASSKTEASSYINNLIEHLDQSVITVPSNIRIPSKYQDGATSVEGVTAPYSGIGTVRFHVYWTASP